MKSANLIKEEIFKPLSVINENFIKVRTLGFIIPEYLDPLKFVKELMKQHKINNFEQLKLQIAIPQGNYVYVETDCTNSPDIIDAEKIDKTKINEVTKALEVALILGLSSDGIYSPDNTLIMISKTLKRCIALYDLYNFYELY